MIEVRELTKRYGRVTAVDNLSFNVLPGHVTSFLGPNGAGKSTTMRVILGLAKPEAGDVIVNGRRYASLQRPLRQVGALLDAGAVHGGRTAGDHLQAIARSNGIGRTRVREVLEITGMDAVSSRRVGGFSLGMKQRLGIAAALLGDPAVLMFDEPLNGLDPDGISWIRALLAALAREGRTVLVASHLMNEMAVIADWVIVIGRGRLLADASIVGFTRSSARGSVLVRSPQTGDLARLMASRHALAEPQADGALVVTGLSAPAISELAAGHGIAVHELSSKATSLEEAYRKLTDSSADYHAGPYGKDSTS